MKNHGVMSSNKILTISCRNEESSDAVDKVKLSQAQTSRTLAIDGALESLRY